MARVDILISSKGTTSESELENSPGNGGQSPTGGSGNTKLMAKSVAAMQLAKAGWGAIKSTFNFAKSNYGNFTGDYIGQQKIDNAFSVATGLVSLGGTVATGAMAGGWVGAAVGLVVGVVNIGVESVQNSINYDLEISKANALANFNSQRIGAILTSGNR